MTSTTAQIAHERNVQMSILFSNINELLSHRDENVVKLGVALLFTTKFIIRVSKNSGIASNDDELNSDVDFALFNITKQHIAIWNGNLSLVLPICLSHKLTLVQNMVTYSFFLKSFQNNPSMRWKNTWTTSITAAYTNAQL